MRAFKCGRCIHDKYFVDLGSSLAATSKVNLEKRLEYVNRDNWAFSGTMQDYRLLDSRYAPMQKHRN